MTRDFIGYGAEPPHARWPGRGAHRGQFRDQFRGRVGTVLPGRRRRVGDRADRERQHRCRQPPRPRRREHVRIRLARRLVAAPSHLHRYKVPVTLFACARALEANPPAAAAIAATDWDICGHGYRWIKHYELDEAAEEREQIARAVALIRETTGKPTEGWYCRYAPSENTRRLVVEHGGFLYDSDAYNDELPYWVRVGGQAASGDPVFADDQRREIRPRHVRAGRGFLRLSARQLRPACTRKAPTGRA